MPLLPGGRIAVPWYRWPHTTIAAGWLLGPVARRVQRRLRIDPRKGREAERRLADSVMRHLKVRLSVGGSVPGAGPYMVVSLHEGFADALALTRLPLHLWFSARDELFDDWPWLGRHLIAHQAANIPTAKPAVGYRRLLRGAAAAVNAGLSPTVFAQGSILGLEVALKEGAFRVASRLKLPILPVAVTGSHRVWEWPYSPTLRYGCTVTMAVLPAVDPPSREDTAAVAVAVGRSLRAAALGRGMAAPRRFLPARDGFWDGYDYTIDPDFPDLADEVRRHRQGS